MKRALLAWNRFWFEPVETSTLALTRIAFALVALVWALSLMPSLGAFFSRGGVLPDWRGWNDRGSWTILGVWDDDSAVAALFVALVVALVALLVGWRSRIAAIAVFVGIVSFERRDPLVFNSGDILLRTTALFLALAPTGAALSVDRARSGARRALHVFPARAPWALRLIQVQLSVLYLATVWAKLRGTTWNDGTAVFYALRLDDLARFPVPHALTNSLIAVNLLTYGALAIELAVGILIWNRAARPYVMAAGVTLHAGIDWSLRVGFFFPALLVSYVAFIPPDKASRLLGWALTRAHQPRPNRQTRIERQAEDPRPAQSEPVR